MLRVLDADSISIPYALVTPLGAAVRVADSTGSVRLDGVHGLSVQVRAQRIGYAPFDGTATRQDPGAPFVLTLKPLARSLDAVRTVAPRYTPLSRTGFYDRVERVHRGAMLGEFVLPEELDLRGAGDVANVRQGKRHVQVRNGALFGRAGCRIQLLVDGRRVDGNVPSRHVSGSDVMAIEVYSSTANAPAELIPLTDRGACGLVAIWTGPRW